MVVERQAMVDAKEGGCLYVLARDMLIGLCEGYKYIKLYVNSYGANGCFVDNISKTIDGDAVKWQ